MTKYNNLSSPNVAIKSFVLKMYRQSDRRAMRHSVTKIKL